MKNVEDFLAEKHELSKSTKANYRMAFQGLGRYTDHPYSLNRQEMTEALNKLEKDYFASSWNAYVNCIRRFYRWSFGDDEEYPEAVRRLRLKPIRHADYVKTKILSDEEIKALIAGAESPRDRAFLAVAAATGARRGELLDLKIRDIVWKPYGYDVVLTGKTGTHPGPPIVKEYAKILRVWLEHHPQRDNPEAPLWVRSRSGHWGSRLQGINRVQGHNIIKKAALAAGIKRNVHLHMLRHTENTLETKRHVPAAARKKLHGWSEMSSVPAVYEHLTDEDSVNEILRSQGLAEGEEPVINGLVKCGYCGTENASISKYCTFCGVLLDEEEAEKVKAKDVEFEELKGMKTQMDSMKDDFEAFKQMLPYLRQLTPEDLKTPEELERDAKAKSKGDSHAET